MLAFNLTWRKHMQLRTIEIDFDIHKMIEAERTSFSEPEFVVLRRLLKLPAPQPKPEANFTSDDGLPFVEDGVTILHGSDARMTYQRGTQVYLGKFLTGKLVVDGREYSALSAAASDLGITKEGTKTSLNGWLYWEVKFPGTAKWHPMKKLRDDIEYRKKQLGK